MLVYSDDIPVVIHIEIQNNFGLDHFAEASATLASSNMWLEWTQVRVVKRRRGKGQYMSELAGEDTWA